MDLKKQEIFNVSGQTKLTNTLVKSTEKTMGKKNYMKVTSEKFQQSLFQITTYSLEDFLAKLLVLLENEKDLEILVELSSLKYAELWKRRNLIFFSLKTSKGYLITTTGTRSELSSIAFQNWGITVNGKCLTARISESHKTGKECSLSDILEEQVDEKYFLSEKVVKRLLSYKDSKSDGDYIIEGNRKALLYEGAIMSEKNKEWIKDGKKLSRNFPQGQRVYSDKGISSTIAGNAGGLGGKTGLYKINQPATIDLYHFLHGEKRPPTSRIMDDGNSATISAAQPPHLINDFKIRRLTPTECERLQGFPDGWTEGISDTQRYKCLGNAVTTNVITEIGKKIKTLFDYTK